MGISLDTFNNYGCSLIFGHPQGPTGMRLIIELIEELALLGGGYGLFTGCVAGDTGASIVVYVDVACICFCSLLSVCVRILNTIYSEF